MTSQEPETARACVLILAPIGRDAQACCTLVERVGLKPRVCADVRELIVQLDSNADVVLLTEEALYGSALGVLAAWVARQPPWSDQPFIVLTNRNEGGRFHEFRRSLVERLHNIAFLERPMRAISLQAAILTAQRGRARQYQARAYLEAQRGAAEELERLVSERTRALEQANAELRAESERRERAQAALLQAQKLETIGQLVGGVAHDFNNLLMAVIGNLDLLAKIGGDDPKQARLLNGAMEGARRGATLTQRLLAFARKQELQSRPTDIRALLEDLRGLIERSVGPLVELRITRCGPTPPVSVDPNQLEMAVLNLAVNARDAMSAGGVVTISLDDVFAQSGDELGLAPGRYARLSIQDTGAGMDPATLARAVEPFFSTKGVGKGTGLGLSMVHGLASQSGGALRLESRLGVGTRADLWLPVAESAVEETSLQDSALAVMEPAKILLVDDDLLVANSTAALLEDLGHRVIEAHSGAEALAAIEGGLSPDLVITDHAMPGMTGVDLAVGLRARDPNCLILLATGYAELPPDSPVDLPRLAKPFTQQQLSVEVARLLATRAA
ncbi:MAG TPA: ATP-binding protein [Caulobacteraceae bacterium]|jgi:signal transduction histidine kinase/CheY-like chemotaxis protein|nr:ATP-binding protein [Caulobacteraceae bacterium]